MMTLKIKLDSTGQISINEQPIADLVALESLLMGESRKEPQPDVRLQMESPADYERIGKIIYMVHRVGFADGKFSVN